MLWCVFIPAVLLILRCKPIGLVVDIAPKVVRESILMCGQECRQMQACLGSNGSHNKACAQHHLATLLQKKFNGLQRLCEALLCQKGWIDHNQIHCALQLLCQAELQRLGVVVMDKLTTVDVKAGVELEQEVILSVGRVQGLKKHDKKKRYSSDSSPLVLT